MTNSRAGAVHEAGHIVAAHFTGFSAEHSCLNAEGDGQTRMDYGELAKVAAPLMTMDICPEFRAFLDQLNREPLYELGKKLCFILLAGAAAEAVSTAKGQRVRVEAEVSGPDLTRAKAISAYLGLDFDEIMKEVSVCVQEEHFAAAISEVTEAILASSIKAIDRHGISEALIRSGFIDFLKQD